MGVSFTQIPGKLGKTGGNLPQTDVSISIFFNVKRLYAYQYLLSNIRGPFYFYKEYLKCPSILFDIYA